MESWLKSAVKAAANLQDLVDGGADDGSWEVEFQAGPLGFELDGITVSAVKPGEQAEKLGIGVGDRVFAVAGYEVPVPKTWDEELKKSTQARVKKWLKEMPRPAPVTFLPAAGEGSPDGAGEAAAPEAAQSAVEAGAAVEKGSIEAVVAAVTTASDPEALEGAAPPAGGERKDLAEQLGKVRAELKAEKERGVTLRAALYVAQEQGRHAESDLEEARKECQALRHTVVEHDESVGVAANPLEVQVRTLQDQLARSKTEVDTTRRRAVELQASLTAAEENCAELQRVGMQAEEVFTDSASGRETVLEEEIVRLRAVHNASEAEHRSAAAAAEERRAAEEERARQELLAEAARRAADRQDLEARFAALAAEKAKVAGELSAEREANAASSQRVQAEHLREVSRLQEQIEEALSRVAAAVAAAEVAKFSETAAAAQEPPKAKAWSPDSDSDEEAREDVEAGGVASVSADADAKESLEVIDLRERLAQMEKRCVVLQKKLNQRPIVFQAKRGGGQEDSGNAMAGQGIWWEPQIRASLGPQAATRVIRLLTAPDRMLKAFMQRLLQRDAWLRFFFLHLVVLYAIAADWYAQTTTADETSALDLLSHGGVVQQHQTHTAAISAGAVAGR